MENAGVRFSKVVGISPALKMYFLQVFYFKELVCILKIFQEHLFTFSGNLSFKEDILAIVKAVTKNIFLAATPIFNQLILILHHLQ